MAHYYRITETQSLAKVCASGQAGQVFPLGFSLVREADALMLEVVAEPDEEVFGRVQQECDRIAFLTGEDPEPRFARKDNPDGSTTASSTRGARTAGYVPIPADLDRQVWDVALPVQLRLWQLAGLPRLPIAVRIVLLFQIIEIAFPNRSNATDYPKYEGPSWKLHPRTEARLLRDLASHGKTAMGNPEIQDYCALHKLPAESHDPRNRLLMQLFSGRVVVVEKEARGIIDQAITRTQQASQ